VIYVNSTAILLTWCGDFAAAASLIAEAEAIAAATGTRFAPFAALWLAGFRGAEAEATPLIEAVIEDSRATGQGLAIQESQLFSAVLYNGLGRYESAVAQAQQASEQVPELFTSMWVLPELIEAASRTGQTRLAADALGRLAEATSVAQTGWGRGIYARSRALLSDGEDAEGWYRQAVDRLSRTALRTELARAPAVRGVAAPPGTAGRRAGATAHRARHVRRDRYGGIRRAGRELRASGETVRRRTTETHDQLTPQEAQIARLARDGLSNSEIGARLFISARTVQYHLGKVFTKLDISSRSQLDRVLPGDPLAPGPADPQDPRSSL